MVLLHSVMATAFGAKQPPYSVIISLDRKIRDFPVPVLWRPVCDTAEGPAPIVPLELNMHRWLVMSRKEMSMSHVVHLYSVSHEALILALLCLHRPYFTQALKDMPTDVARHRYIPSVIAIYRSAWRIIEGLQLTWRRIPQALARFNLAWSHGLAAAVSYHDVGVIYVDGSAFPLDCNVFARKSSTNFKHDTLCFGRNGYGFKIIRGRRSSLPRSGSVSCEFTSFETDLFTSVVPGLNPQPPA